MASHRALILLGLGSNLGDRRVHLRDAVARIGAFVDILRISHVYETPALLPDNAPAEWNQPFLNCCARGYSMLEPEELLMRCKEVEHALGRIDRGMWAPREIDVDILAMDSMVREHSTPLLPHPHMHKREFVLFPLAEIAGEWRFPKPPFEGKTVEQIIDAQGLRNTPIIHRGAL